MSAAEGNGIMTTRRAMSLIIISSLAVLLAGCAGAAGQSAREDAAMGLALGRVIVKDDFSPTRGLQPSLGRQPVAARTWSADVLRELKGSAPLILEQPFSAEAWRELKSQPVVVGQHPIVVGKQFSAEVRRELKGSTSGTQRTDNLSRTTGGG